jgi:cation transport protein ChaC
MMPFPPIPERNLQELQSSIDAMRAQRPEQRDVWIFAYGSLMWNPEIHLREARIATLDGFHRQFCLWCTDYRGTSESPGLVLGLEPGARCTGRALCVAEEFCATELLTIWKREMFSDAYIPTWVTLQTETEPLDAIAFVVNVQHPQYVQPRLSLSEIAHIIARAQGNRGPCTEYLNETVHCLRRFGIHDAELENLFHLVQDEVQGTRGEGT